MDSQIGFPCFAGCGRDATHVCSSCGYAAYCSQECQLEDAKNFHHYEHTIQGWLPDPTMDDTLETLGLTLAEKREELLEKEVPLEVIGEKWIQKIHMKKGAERRFLRRTHQSEAEALRNPRTSATNKRRINLARTLRKLSHHKRK